MYDLAGKRVWVAGHRGMVGSALVRRLQGEGCELLTAGREVLDLTRQAAVEKWMARERPDAIFLAAARVGGIHANSTYPAEFIAENLAIALNVIAAAHRLDVDRLLFLGSSCVYPKHAPQPMSEDVLLTGSLEPTNEWYAVAKIAGMKLCQAYRRQYGRDYVTVMPTNLYGPGDNYHPEHSHVPAALMRRFHEARVSGAEEAAVWGSGAPRREFLHVDDLADACVFVLRNYTGEQILNVGTGRDMAIAEFATLVADVVGFQGRLVFDGSRPDGTPRKLLDVSRLASLGWNARIGLRDGLGSTYSAYLEAARDRRGTAPEHAGETARHRVVHTGTEGSQTP